MMRRAKVLVLAGLVCACFSIPAWADYSVGFATGQGHNSSWTVTVAQGQAVLSFENNKIYISNPSPDPVLGDGIALPDMVLSNIQSTTIGMVQILTADLIPDGNPLTIADTVVGSVMSADIYQGGMLTIGTNFIAYSNEYDDLDVISYLANYSTVIDAFATLDDLGFDLDLSFGGDVSSSLYTLLDTMNDGSVSGTLSGQISIIPEPLTLSLLGVGALVFLKKKRTM